MALTVEEIMNRELFALSASERIENARRYLVLLGITGAPVLEDGRALGVVSLRDLSRGGTETLVRDVMTGPAFGVEPTTTIQEAGRRLAETGYHRLLVMDPKGKVIGLVSALDVVRGLLGLPASHPATFPHHDKETGLFWSDDVQLNFEYVEAAPEAPGVFVIIHGGPAMAETVVWAEASDNIRRRLVDILSTRVGLPRNLMSSLDRGHLRFRAATTPDPAVRDRTLSYFAGSKASHVTH